MKPQSSVVKPLALTLGDPAGVGPLCTAQAWQELKDEKALSFYLRAPLETVERLLPDIPRIQIQSPAEAIDTFCSALPVLETGEHNQVIPGTPNQNAANTIISSIKECVADVQKSSAAAVVTNPISKELLYKTGFKHPGHTEYLAHLASEHSGKDVPRPVMMLVGGGLKVSLATIHIPLMSVADTLSQALICEIAEITLNALECDFGLSSPKLGVCGLNPHAGENGSIGQEDHVIISPAIKALQAKGMNVTGPRPGDTIFHEARSGEYDAVLAMYHDQGLIPVKTLDIWGGVNITLGLPFIRTSPDHGTGYDAAKSGNANPKSLIAAIKKARFMADNRQRYRTYV